MQDAFLKLWERWDRIDRIADPTAYLFRVALNGSRMRARAARRAARRLMSVDRDRRPGRGKPIRLTFDDHASFQPADASDGRIAYRKHGPDDIVVMRGDGANPRVITPDALDPWSPAWSPDGSKIAFLRCCSDHQSLSGRPLLEMVVIDLATARLQRLGVYVETENNVPQWTSNTTLLVNRSE
jgi:hypothetical protein